MERLTGEMERMNRQLAESRGIAEEATRLKSEFLTNMSHEIRTPLNGVVGMLSLLSETSLDGEQMKMANTAEDSANALIHIINDVLDFSKIETGKLAIEEAPFSPSELLEACTQVHRDRASAKGIQLSLQHNQLPDCLLGDSVRFRQIVSNLLSNAVKFTAQGQIRAKCQVLSENVTEAELQIEIADTGIGFPETHLKKIFQPFVQVDGSTSRSFGGSGLGLSICRRLAGLMGGGLNAPANPARAPSLPSSCPSGKRSRSGDPRSERPSDTADRGQASPLRILVAEDNPVNQEVMRRILQRLGMHAALPATVRHWNYCVHTTSISS